MNTQTVQGGHAERILWLVEGFDEWVKLLTSLIDLEVGPSVKVRSFSKPELALEALQRNEGPPDVLITAFYFDGYCRNGLWLVQEARKTYPELLTAVTSGFPLEHLKGVAADWQVQPNLLLHKGGHVVEDWLPALKELLAQRDGVGPTQRPVQRVQVVSEVLIASKEKVGPGERRRRKVRGKPLVYFVGPVNSLNTLKRCMGRETQPPRFKHGYDWEHFENPEAAWARLEEVREKPEALVTDYYLSGGQMNGLKVVRHAQRVVPGIWTVLVSWCAEEHIRGIMEGTSISPDLFFYCRDYRAYHPSHY